ncbi:DUF2163 domain-containing protein [Pseudaminobacter sp. 19-2017]|uniref:DUF2163 domain-containing protein n=1 Tax=Pseudaminobacter soli (ex Zhang et al. 2022) TaxID=2831468 RepID=A0A942DX13_9HYPH|nr:DUF2163 domain-containing protein [Pseudaminobacter soli]MBS3648871.1 DUF2163 domain-containing protein [Pseudaminobacter soli]
MPKNITPAMKTHLAQDVTTLTTCWKITRTDGKVFAYTELDKSLTYKGVRYSSIGGFNKSAIQSTATFSVDNMEVSGFLSDDTIPDEEMRNGAFDYAEVEVFMVNYMDLSANMGDIKLRYGKFGEVKRAPSGAFLVELRGLIQLLSQKVGQIFQPECRADFGDHRCKINLFYPIRKSGFFYKKGERVRVADISFGYRPETSIGILNDNFQEGDVKWTRNYGTAVSEGTLQLDPPDDQKNFIRITGIEAGGGNTTGLWQTRTLLSDGVSVDDISTGELKLRVAVTAAQLQYGSGWRVDLTYYRLDSRGGLLVTTTRRWIPPRAIVLNEWDVYTHDFDLPPDTRSVQVRINTHQRDEGQAIDFGIAKVKGSIVFPNSTKTEVEDYVFFGGVEYVALNDGVTATGQPEFSRTPGDEVVDGEVTWQCADPVYVYMDAAAVDATRSATITAATLDKPDDYFKYGVMTFLEGENIGRRVEILGWNNLTKEFKLALPMPRKTLAGERFQIARGCAKTRQACRAHGNIINMRAEPDIPGMGQYFRVAGTGTGSPKTWRDDSDEAE